MQFLDNSRHFFRFWMAGIRASVIREMEFRTNFFLGIIRQLVWFGIFILMINIIFKNTSSLGGWSRPEVLIILALSRLIEGLINTLYSQNLISLPQVVQKGEFDTYLTKPLPVQLYTSFRRISFQNIGNILAGIGLLIYAFLSSDLTLTLSHAVLFALLAVLGLTIYYCLLILTATLVFFLDRLEALWGMWALFSEPLTVPFDIFPSSIRILLTYLLPIAFAVFVPAQALTNRLHWQEVPLALVITIIFLTLANLAWRAGLRRYSSASS